jgi:hypothetical protein
MNSVEYKTTNLVFTFVLNIPRMLDESFARIDYVWAEP